MTLPGIETAAFRFVAQHLNHCASYKQWKIHHRQNVKIKTKIILHAQSVDNIKNEYFTSYL